MRQFKLEYLCVICSMNKKLRHVSVSVLSFLLVFMCSCVHVFMCSCNPCLSACVEQSLFYVICNLSLCSACMHRHVTGFWTIPTLCDTCTSCMHIVYMWYMHMYAYRIHVIHVYVCMSYIFRLTHSKTHSGKRCAERKAPNSSTRPSGPRASCGPSTTCLTSSPHTYSTRPCPWRASWCTLLQYACFLSFPATWSPTDGHGSSRFRLTWNVAATWVPGCRYAFLSLTLTLSPSLFLLFCFYLSFYITLYTDTHTCIYTHRLTC